MTLTAAFAATVAAAVWLALIPADPAAPATPAPSAGPRSAGEAAKAGTKTPGSAVLQNVQTPVTPVAERAFPDEGVWHVLATGGDGDPVVQGTSLHTDRATASVVWIHQSAARFELHPGYNQPGGSWDQPDMLPPGGREGLVATWNGGFLMRDSGGGFYLDGKQAGALVPGVASEVFRRDGSMTVGLWGRDAAMGPDVVGVRQQRRLLVDGGRVAPDIDDLGAWGATDSGAEYVRRSGVGVTAQGDVVYVIGPAMSPRSLATALQRAGAVRAMQLDINISWPSVMAYDGRRNPLNPRPFKAGDFPRAAERYYSPSARDFVAVFARSTDGPAAGTCVGTDGSEHDGPETSGTSPVAC
jgi:hypothetical protein